MFFRAPGWLNRLDVGNYLRPAALIARVRGIKAQALDDIAITLGEFGRDCLGFANNSKRVEDLVGDEIAHFDPLALLGERIELRLQIVPAMDLENTRIGGG